MHLRFASVGPAAICALGIVIVGAGMAAWAGRQDANSTPLPLPTGKAILPQGTQIGVGSFPANMALSPDGKWIAVTDTGFRQYLSILSAEDGRLVSQLAFNPKPDDEKDNTSLYAGLAFSPTEVTPNGEVSFTLYASRGPQDKITILNFNPADGKLTDTGRTLDDPSSLPAAAGNARPNFVAGIALNQTGTLLYAANNETSAHTGYKGSVSILSIADNRVVCKVPTPGFPYAIAALTTGAYAGKKVYVASERDGVVSDLDVSDPAHAVDSRDIKTGDHPMALLLDRAQARLFVANAAGDTVSIIDTSSDRVLQTISLRGRSKLPGMTPTGLALSPDESRLYVTLGDMNALAVISLSGRAPALKGFLPTGWYPTAVIANAGHLFVANAKGVQPRNPNGAKVGPEGAWGQYIENIIEGTVSVMPVPSDADVQRLTGSVLAANLSAGLTRMRMERTASQTSGDERSVARADPGHNAALPQTGIKHVIYIIKENRTYDQVLGDLPQGNGDSSLVLFGREVTPNLHTLAERFVLLDNYYCSGEVSADGWNWCTEGMGSEYTERNVPFNYSGRGRGYDFEGETNGVPVDLLHMPDVAQAPGGHIWDAVAKKGLTYRDYGFFLTFGDSKSPDGKLLAKANTPDERVLVGHTDLDFLRFDTSYADSDAYRTYSCPAPKQILTYGEHQAPDRFAEWKREFDEYVKNGNLPAFEMVRLMRDHTAGTSVGQSTPRAMVADNDYAVGQLVEAVSKSPYWRDTAIFVVEDDAQDGYDHVDAHRSIAFIISPYVPEHTVDHHFYNTDSVLHTMEQLLGIGSMCQYDAIAPVIDVFGGAPDNAAPYNAILPARSIIAEVNAKTAYRARDSAKFDFTHADQAPEEALNDIIWHSVKGAGVPAPNVSGEFASLKH